MIDALLAQMLFYPVRYPEGDWDPGRWGLRFEDVYFNAADGPRLHGWYLPPGAAGGEGSDAAADAPTILFSHGNAGHIGDRLHNVRLLVEHVPCHLLIYDYRGYGRSEGRPTEKGLVADAEAAYDTLAARVPGARRFLFGRSLGGAVTVALAATRPADGVILESTFTSIRDMASALMPVVPGFIVPDAFPSERTIAGLRAPLLVFHGERDELVPFDHGRRLVAAATSAPAAELVPIPDAGHNDTYIRAGVAYFEKIREFLGG